MKLRREAPTYCLLHLVPSDQSIDLSCCTVPNELKVPPALIVVALVILASAMAPSAPLICRSLPDWVIEGEAPGHVHGSGLGLHCQVPPSELCVLAGSAAPGFMAPCASALAVTARPHSTAAAAQGKI